METDSGGDQIGDSLDFVLDFDFDDEDLLHNPNSPMTSTHLPGETLGNLLVVRKLILTFCMNTHLI